MGRRATWREGETRIISVTPVARGVLRPLTLAVLLATTVVVASEHWGLVHDQEKWVALVFVGPAVLILVTRTWRWRSHKIHVTSERIVVEGGVAHRLHSAVELRDVHGIHVEQRVRERLTRRGTLYVETPDGPFYVGLVRHPLALSRLIDRERASVPSARLPFDTVFQFDDPASHDFEINPRRPDDRR